MNAAIPLSQQTRFLGGLASWLARFLWTLSRVFLGLLCAGCVSAYAQSSDSASLSAGSPPLPTGVWNAQDAATDLSSQMSTITTNMTSIGNTATAAYNLASAAASSASKVVAGSYSAPGPNNDYFVYDGICSSTYTSYLVNYSTQYPSAPGTYVCPASMPYFYIMSTSTYDYSQGGTE